MNNRPVINLIEGKLTLRNRNLISASDKELNTLAEEAPIEKQKDAIGNHYCTEAEGDDMSLMFSSVCENFVETKVGRPPDNKK